MGCTASKNTQIKEPYDLHVCMYERKKNSKYEFICKICGKVIVMT